MMVADSSGSSKTNVKSTLLTHICSMRLLSAIGKPFSLDSRVDVSTPVDILLIHPNTQYNVQRVLADGRDLLAWDSI